MPLADAVRQWANLGALVDGLHRADFALISRALEDTIAEPRRASLVPGLAAIKQATMDAGALGCSLSGSGPSLFALCRGEDAAQRVADAMTERLPYTSVGDIPDIRLVDLTARCACDLIMRFVSTKGPVEAITRLSRLRGRCSRGWLRMAGCIVPESVPGWSASDLARLPSMSLAEGGTRALTPLHRATN